MLIREDMADIRFWLDGVPYFGAWRTAEGGVLEAEDAKTRPGGMGSEVSAGGPASRDDLTLTTQFTEVVAIAHPTIESKVGFGRAKVGITWLNPDKSSTGLGRTLQGTLKSAYPPDHTDGSDVGMYTVVISCDQDAA